MLFDVACGRKGGGAVQARVNRKPFRKFLCKNETFKNVKSTECVTRYEIDRFQIFDDSGELEKSRQLE